MAKQNQEFIHSDTMVIGNPRYTNLDMTVGQQSPVFQIVNADGQGRYRVWTVWSGNTAVVALVNSSGSQPAGSQNGGCWIGSLPAGSYAFKILSGTPTKVHAGIERLN